MIQRTDKLRFSEISIRYHDFKARVLSTAADILSSTDVHVDCGLSHLPPGNLPYLTGIFYFNQHSTLQLYKLLIYTGNIAFCYFLYIAYCDYIRISLKIHSSWTYSTYLMRCIYHRDSD